MRRILIGVVGGSVLLIGFAMIFLPGPSSLVIPAGLAILAIEFAWARHWLNHTRDYIARQPPLKSGIRGAWAHWSSFFANRKLSGEPRTTPLIEPGPVSAKD